MNKLMKMVVPSFTLIFALSASAVDPKIEWTGAKDLNLDDLSNWKKQSDSSPVEKFPSDDLSYLSVVPAGDLTISGTSFSLYRFWIRANASFAFDAGQTFKMSNRLFVEGGSTVQVEGGTVGATADIFVGDSTANNLFVATGNGTKIEAGALRVGTAANGSTIRFEKGVKAETSLGVVGRKNAKDNTLVAAGEKTKLSIVQLYVGNGEESQSSVHNGLVISNGATVAVTTCSVFGNYTAQSCENYLEVGKGGMFSTIGYTYVGNNGSSNVVCVTDGGVLAVTNSTMTVGLSATAKWNVVNVAAGGALHIRQTASGNSDVYVGQYGSGNVLRFDDGDLVRGADSESVRLIVGQYAGANGNRLEVLNGSTVDVSRLIVGDQGNDSKLILSNATIRVKGDSRCQISANAGHTGNDFIISGPAARFEAQQINMGGNSKLVFNIPKEGFDDVPIKLDNAIFRTNSETPEIVINPPEGVRKGGWHTLMRVGSSYNLVDCLSGFTMTAPQGVRVSVEKTELKVRYSSNAGMMLIVRGGRA